MARNFFSLGIQSRKVRWIGLAQENPGNQFLLVVVRTVEFLWTSRFLLTVRETCLQTLPESRRRLSLLILRMRGVGLR
jgi:hypothetical protein